MRLRCGLTRLAPGSFLLCRRDKIQSRHQITVLTPERICSDMADRRVKDFAYQHRCSNREAKRRLGRKRRGLGAVTLPGRGLPVAGTGKPGGGAKV